MRRFGLLVFGAVAILAAAGCGSVSMGTPATAAPAQSSPTGSQATAAPASTPAPTSAPTATPAVRSATATPSGVTGGAGDMADNPDTSFICAASGQDDNGNLVAYLTVAGTDSSNGQSLCDSLEGAPSSWTEADTIPAGGYYPTPGCYVTTDGSQLTARIYTAQGGSTADTTELCNALLQSAGLPTMAP
jgi:hypothetical protein